MHPFSYHAMCAFDVLIILKQNTGLAQSDVLLAEDALSYGLPVVFVQSKCDHLLEDALEDGSYTTYDAEGRAVVPSAQEAANMLVTERKCGAASKKRNAHVFIPGAQRGKLKNRDGI